MDKEKQVEVRCEECQDIFVFSNLEVKEKSNSSKKKLTNSSKAYYIEGSRVYHSSKACTACKGKKLKSSTVKALKKIKLTRGSNKGKRKYRACSKCWK